jgi:hypothetical protein
MTVSAIPNRLVEVSGAEALWLLEGCRRGRLVYVQRGVPLVRPATHVLEYGRLIVRTPVPTAALADADAVTYHVDEIRAVNGIGWTATATGPFDVIDDADEAAHHRRTLAGLTHGPHDTLLRIHPKAMAGFRLARPEA